VRDIDWARRPVQATGERVSAGDDFHGGGRQMPEHPALTITSAFFSGMFLGASGVGVIALATVFYPTLISSTELGWGLVVARAGQVCGPLATGWMLRSGMGASQISLVLGLLPLIAAAAVLLLRRNEKGLVAVATLKVAAHRSTRPLRSIRTVARHLRAR
jgi:MFS family permease